MNTIALLLVLLNIFIKVYLLSWSITRANQKTPIGILLFKNFMLCVTRCYKYLKRRECRESLRVRRRRSCIESSSETSFIFYLYSIITTIICCNILFYLLPVICVLSVHHGNEGTCSPAEITLVDEFVIVEYVCY